MSKIFDDYQNAFENIFSESYRKDVRAIVKRIKKYDKVLVLGNGGSCTIATHFGEDLAKMCRIPTLVFNDAALITCLSNDYSYEDAMVEWIRIYGDRTRDYYDPRVLVIFISSSGESKNVVNAAKYFEKEDTITLSGFKKDNSLSKLGSINLHVPIENYGVVESIHATLLHIILDTLIEEKGMTND